MTPSRETEGYLKWTSFYMSKSRGWAPQLENIIDYLENDPKRDYITEKRLETSQWRDRTQLGKWGKIENK